MEQSDLIAQARALSGENFVGSRPQFPTIKFMGRSSQYGEIGKFYLLEKNVDGNLGSSLIGDSVDVTILRVRKMLDNGGSEEKRVFSYEFESTAPGQMIVMKAGRGEAFQISYQDARQKYPDLKYIEVLYVAYAGKLCKMKVSGGSLGNLFSYFQAFPYNDTFMRYITKLSSESVKHSQGDYAAMVFTRGDIDQNFEKYLQMIKQMTFSTPPIAVLPAPSNEGIDAPHSATEDEINIEDIPF